MLTLLRLGLLACCAGLALMLVNRQTGPFDHLIVAPALALIGSLLLIPLALGALLRSPREYHGANVRERSDT